MAEAPDAVQPGLGEDLRGLALISLGSTEYWTARFEDAGRHLDQGIALAHRIGRPFLEFTGLAYQAAVEALPVVRSGGGAQQAGDRAGPTTRLDRRAARRHRLQGIGRGIGQPGAAGRSRALGPARRTTLRTEAGPAAVAVRYIRGLLELTRGHDADALAALQAAERLAGHLATPHYIVPWAQALHMYALIRLGETERAAQALAGLGEHDRERGEIRVAAAALRLAQDDPHAATVALDQLLDGPLPSSGRPGGSQPSCWRRSPATRSATRRGRAGPGTWRSIWPARRGPLVFPAVSRAGPARAPCPAPHHPRRADRRDPQPAGRKQARIAARRAAAARAANRQRTARAALPADQPDRAGNRPRAVHLPQHGQNPLRNLYAKLGTHHRAETVERARALGLLAPSRAVQKKRQADTAANPLSPTSPGASRTRNWGAAPSPG